MPRKNTRELPFVDELYHVYNRGIHKQLTFLDGEDSLEFLEILKESIGTQITLGLFCLMTNHFHLLIRQNLDEGVTRFMTTIQSRYTKYFNKRHGREGPLFERPFGRVRIKTEAQYQRISEYIHENALAITPDIEHYEFSSFQYLSDRSTPDWLDPSIAAVA